MEENRKKLCDDLWKNYEAFVHGLVMRRMPDRPKDVEDVVAEVAAALCTLYDSGETLEYPTAWLVRTTSNLINKKFAEIQRTNRIVEKLSSTVQLSYEINFDDVIITEAAIEEAKRKILGQLDPKERKLYTYIYIEDKPYREIADLMGTTASAVKQRAYRLNDKIRRLMKDALENDLN